ncbi:MAG: hypothetical protein K0Q95_3212 [Bacteroidota bacterium]|jgi:hypothetical protein|nr:hypothetical protein [Bacteroidota bacterium]
MKNLVKLTLLFSTIIALTSCRKTEFNSVTPSTAQNTPSYKLVHDGSANDPGGVLFTEKDKCKKCHTSSRTMDLNWSAPYMSDNRYSSIEELVSNYDFVKNEHIKKGDSRPRQNTISAEETDELISYLKSLEQAQATK